MKAEGTNSTVHAVITGGAGGIGTAIAQALAESGVKLTLMGRNESRLREKASLFKDSCAMVCDVTDEESVQSAFAASISRHGPVSILINNAGMASSAPLQKTSLEDFTALINVNLTGAFLCSRQVITNMIERRAGRIINIASTAGLKGYPYVAAYCAAKHGLIGLTRSLALEVADKGVIVNAVCPGYTDTDLLKSSIDMISVKTGQSKEALRDTFSGANPQHRLVRPEEIASVTQYLSLRSPSSITGVAIPVAGGEMA